MADMIKKKSFLDAFRERQQTAMAQEDMGQVTPKEVMEQPSVETTPTKSDYAASVAGLQALSKSASAPNQEGAGGVAENTLSGAAAGTAINPGAGTAIGAAAGGVIGILKARQARKEREELARQKAIGFQAEGKLKSAAALSDMISSIRSTLGV